MSLKSQTSPQEAFPLDYHGLLALCTAAKLGSNVSFHHCMSGSLVTKGTKPWMLCPQIEERKEITETGTQSQVPWNVFGLLDNLHPSLVQRAERPTVVPCL